MSFLARNNEHKLPNSVVYLLVPGNLLKGQKQFFDFKSCFSVFPTHGVLFLIGLFSNHGPLYFVNTKTYFSKMGLACHIARIHSEVVFIRGF